MAKLQTGQASQDKQDKTEKEEHNTKVAKTLIMSTHQTSEPQSVTQFKAIFKTYLDVRNGSKEVRMVRGQEQTYAQRSINAFGNLINFIYNNQDDLAVLEMFRKTMVQYRNNELSCENALQGMNYITSQMLRNRFSIMYILMFELTNPTRTRTDWDWQFASSVCNNPNKQSTNAYVSYIESRMR